jgi:hypothetical protein
MKSHPLNKSALRKIERAIRLGWHPGISLGDAFRAARLRRRRNSRLEAGNNAD